VFDCCLLGGWFIGLVCCLFVGIFLVWLFVG